MFYFEKSLFWQFISDKFSFQVSKKILTKVDFSQLIWRILLFSVCASTSGFNGTCYTASECAAKGGSAGWSNHQISDWTQVLKQMSNSFILSMMFKSIKTVFEMKVWLQRLVCFLFWCLLRLLPLMWSLLWSGFWDGTQNQPLWLWRYKLQ